MDVLPCDDDVVIRRWFYVFAAVLLAFAPPASAQEACPTPGDATNVEDRAMAHIRYLADDRLEGREVGSMGARCAADYIAAEFREMGLEPAGGDDSFFQTFRLRKGSELGNANALVIGGTQYAVGSDWTPLGFSANGRLERELVYGGHGLSQPGNPDDRYTHIDLSGKIVVLEWGDPVDAHGVSTRGTPHAKATIIEGRGAAGVLVLAPEGMPLPSLEAEYRAALGVPVAVVSNDVADAIRAAANESSTANVVTDVRPTSMEARNVVALLPGTGGAFTRWTDALVGGLVALVAGKSKSKASPLQAWRWPQARRQSSLRSAG